MTTPSSEARRDGVQGAAVECVRLEARHHKAMEEFFAIAWGGSPTPSPNTDAPAWGLLVDGRIAGYIGTLPVRFWDGAEERSGHWMKGFMVLPEYRNGGIGFLVLREAARHLPVAGSLSVAPAARRLFTAVGFQELGTLSNQLALLRPWRILGTLDPVQLGVPLPRTIVAALRLAQRTGLATAAGALFGAATALWRFMTRIDTAGLTCAFDAPRPADIDRLWRRLRFHMSAGVVRDAEHFARYRAGYRFVTIRRGGAIQGIAVVRLPRDGGDPRLRGLRVAVVAELLVNPSDSRVQRALLRGAERLAFDAGADALLCSASHAVLRRLLRRQLYLPFPGNVRLLVRGFDNARPFDEWWLTRADGHADEVF